MNNKYLWIVVGVIVLVLVGWGLMNNMDQSALNDGTENPSDSVNPSASVNPTATPRVGTSTTGSGAVSLSYAEALKKYEGRRIQFDARCQASPSSLTVKNGTQIMFDNRSGDGRWFGIDGVGTYLSGYGFKIVTMSHKSLPHTALIDCGGAQNVTKILIQK